MSVRNAVALGAFLVVTALAATLGNLGTGDAINTWYRTLERPSWTPPDWVFGPVWTALYALMAVAAWLVWLRPASPERRIALALYGMQLALNAAWSAIFFGSHALAAALFEIVLLLVAIALTIVAFARIDRRAAWLLAPYLAWVSYATTLNAGFWWLNH